MKKALTIFSAILLLMNFAWAQQPMQLEYEIEDRTEDINDASVTVNVTGGTPPYTYKWSNQSTPLTSNQSTGLVEGMTVSVSVIDAANDTLHRDIKIPATSNQELLNSRFKPVVDYIGSILFWDPFAQFGLYDPVVYDDQGEPVTLPNGDIQTTSVPLIVVWLVLGALFFTLFMKFVNIRGFKHAIDLVRGRYDNPEDDGEVSHFQALATALSATVGLGNIAGVAVAITVGGAGATFWMIIAGLLGMSAKFTECTLGVKYRQIDKEGHVSGGPMYYLSRGLAKRNWGVLGKVLAVVFAILCIGASFGGGNMFQANQAFAQMSGEFTILRGHGTMFGIILAILVGIVIIGGIRSIARVTDKIVPIMCGLYVLFAVIIIFLNIANLGSAFAEIYYGAFDPGALKGGVIGVLIVGFQRAAFSNEAGIGSASIAHSASKTNEPVSEGIVALLEPFIDTIVVCTMTALVLIFAGFSDGATGLQGSELTSAAFSSVFPWFKYVLIIAIFLFAFSTMISWSYYGMKAWTYIFGNKKSVEYTYKVIFLIFIVIGSSSSLGAVLDFSDMMILGMAFPNILGLLLLSGEVRKDLRDYFDRVKSGAIKRFK